MEIPLELESEMLRFLRPASVISSASSDFLPLNDDQFFRHILIIVGLLMLSHHFDGPGLWSLSALM